MAKPQKENGFTPVAHEIIEAISKFAFNGSQFRIILIVWRMTYGFNRKEHDLSQSFIKDCTGLSESTIKREVNMLIKYNVLSVTQEATKTKSRRIAFNKDYDSWKVEKEVKEIAPIQLDLAVDEGSDSIPPIEIGGSRFDTSEGSSSTPQKADMRVQIRPLYKESNSLKKSIKEKEDMFLQFYNIYPRRINKKTAEAAWKKLCKDKEFEPDKTILQTMNFAETCKKLKTDTKFIPYPATYLNQKRFEDYEVVDPEGLANEKKKQSKVNSNLKFLERQIRGEVDEQATGSINYSQSIGSLPEPSN